MEKGSEERFKNGDLNFPIMDSGLNEIHYDKILTRLWRYHMDPLILDHANPISIVGISSSRLSRSIRLPSKDQGR